MVKDAMESVYNSSSGPHERKSLLQQLMCSM